MGLEFGQFVTVCAELVKRRERSETTWNRITYNEPKRMLYIGKRTVYEGRTEREYDDYESGYLTHFTQENHINVLLCVENERCNPVYIHPDDIVPVTNDLCVMCNVYPHGTDSKYCPKCRGVFGL